MAKKKKDQDKEPVTQTLPVLQDPPGAVAAEANKLVFHVSPLSSKGLLSQQTRDALKALMQLNKGVPVAKLRAFVAGTGDLRRVQTLVSEAFTDKRLPIPALTTVQVGALPMAGAQVLIEAVSVDKRTISPAGLRWIAARPAASADAAVDRIRQLAGPGSSLVRLTCYVSDIDLVERAQRVVSAAFPQAATAFLQPLRLPMEPSVSCEAIARAVPGGAASSEVADVGSPKVVLSGVQMAFRDQDADIRLAFDRMQRALEPLGAVIRDIVYINYYPMTRNLDERARAIHASLLQASATPSPAPVATSLIFESLPSLDASMAMDVVAIPKK